jgi:hypothetical protein
LNPTEYWPPLLVTDVDWIPVGGIVYTIYTYLKGGEYYGWFSNYGAMLVYEKTSENIR